MAVTPNKISVAEYRKQNPPKESDEQAELVRWARNMTPIIPHLEMLFAIPNGSKLPYRKDRRGNRVCKEAIKLKREGLLPGVPDLMLAYPACDYHGLFIEMKRAVKSKSRISDEQKEMVEKLRAEGYRVEICYGWEAARDTIMDYLGMR